MKTIFTGLHPTDTAAYAVTDALLEAGHQASYVDILTQAVPAAMKAARVSDMVAAARLGRPAVPRLSWADMRRLMPAWAVRTTTSAKKPTVSGS